MYLFLGESGSGKTTAANTLAALLKTKLGKVIVYHPFDLGKRFLENVYGLQSGDLDKAEVKERLLLDLEGHPLVWGDGRIPSYSELMVEEFFFRQKVDPYFSSRCIKAFLKDLQLEVIAGITEVLFHGVRKPEELKVILDFCKNNSERLTVIKLSRKTSKAKESDKYLVDLVEMLVNEGITVHSLINDDDMDDLKDKLSKLFPYIYLSDLYNNHI